MVEYTGLLILDGSTSETAALALVVDRPIDVAVEEVDEAPTRCAMYVP